jgi:glycosyltransferase involved in cell wall biosynthesis
MKIGIDGRLWEETGVGRYIRALVRELGEIDKNNKYILWLRKKDFDIVKPPNNNWKIREAEIPWHTMSEQLFMPGIYSNENVDLIHIPYFSVPFFTPKPFIVAIHDLTISDFATGKATTKPMPIYTMKRIGYNFILNNAIKQAEKIITVSNTVRNQIINRYKVKPEKVVVTYESGEIEKIATNSGRDFTITFRKTDTPKNYLLYVGNAHPHKNLEKLIKAFQLVKAEMPEMHLVLIGKDDFFYKKLKNWVNQEDLGDRIKFINEVNNTQLVEFYNNASLFVFPSLSEGFGIPGLEAMSLGCPVAVSDIGVFREIYGEAAFYFNQNDERDIGYRLLKYLELLKDKATKEKIVEKGKKQSEKYSWKKMAKETLKIYKNCAI